MTTAAPSRFLELRELAALEGKRFSTRQRIEGRYSGRHVSRQFGGAGEFVDYREYTPGEDLRRLDWRVLARTGRPYVKLFQDETSLICSIVLDNSSSMRFGSASETDLRGSKLEYAQYLATALTYVISRGQDQVGLAVASDGLRDYIPPGSTSLDVARMHETIADLPTLPDSRLDEALHSLFTQVSRRGVLLLISDMLVDDLEKLFAEVRLFRHRQWEVIFLHLVHPGEESLPEGAAFRFEDLENGGRVDCSPSEIRTQYERQFADYLASVRTLALAGGCDYRRVSTAVPYLQTLTSFLVDRSG